jgi:hypothetical protein
MAAVTRGQVVKRCGGAQEGAAADIGMTLPEVGTRSARRTAEAAASAQDGAKR